MRCLASQIWDSRSLPNCNTFTSKTFIVADCKQFSQKEVASNSVTRFGEILPSWQIFNSLRPFPEGLFNIWKHGEPALRNLF